MKQMILTACVLAGTGAYAQDTTLSEKKTPAFAFSGYMEAYYSYDFNQPANHRKEGFLYSHNRHNEFNLNLGFLKGSYATENVRANLALAAGTYMNANYAAEPGLLNNVLEANAGIRLSGKKNLWLDAGIFSSHIGFESALSKDCYTLTRSILAENSPYFESGAKLTYTSPNNQWMLSGLVLNGWQRIQRVNGNSLLSFGTQVQFKPSSSTTINYSTFIGTDQPDSTRRMRYFHNLYSIFNIGKLGVITGFDIGSEQSAKNSNALNTWYAPVLMLRCPVSEKWTLAARGEYYEDKKEVIITTGTPHGFQTTGYSLNIDYSPSPNAVVRLEGRRLTGKDEVFTKGDRKSAGNMFVTGSLAVWF